MSRAPLLHLWIDVTSIRPMLRAVPEQVLLVAHGLRDAPAYVLLPPSKDLYHSSASSMLKSRVRMRSSGRSTGDQGMAHQCVRYTPSPGYAGTSIGCPHFGHGMTLLTPRPTECRSGRLLDCSRTRCARLHHRTLRAGSLLRP